MTDFEQALKGLLEYGTVSMNGEIVTLLDGERHHE
jgi:hypothetical protein